ncbi:hypothetical protein ACFLYB_03995 [Chloroflexota bacterium]
MPNTDIFIVMGLGGLFVLLGIGSLFWGRNEREAYYKAISSRNDVREYMQHTPERPEPVGLKIGGYIAIIVGLAMLVMGGIFWLCQ